MYQLTLSGIIITKDNETTSYYINPGYCNPRDVISLIDVKNIANSVCEKTEYTNLKCNTLSDTNKKELDSFFEILNLPITVNWARFWFKGRKGQLKGRTYGCLTKFILGDITIDEKSKKITFVTKKSKDEVTEFLRNYDMYKGIFLI